MRKINFCPAPFMHMYVHSNEGNRVCCMSTEDSIITDETDMDLEKRWQSEHLQNIRTKFLDNEKPDICSKCFNIEENGGISDRYRFLELYEYIDLDLDVVTGNQFNSPIDLDIRPGNLCNLKCRMCGPVSSSQIQKEVKRNNEILSPIYGAGTIKTSDVLQNDKNIEFLLKNADKGRRIKFLGGEPTIMPEVDRFLDILISNGMTDTPIHFTTNCTNNKKSFIDKISKFSAISFNYSIDGTGKVVEYIREPVKFETINENIKIYHSIATDGQITYTYQAYNFFNLLDTLRWSEELQISVRPEILIYPNWCNIRVLPVRVRHKFIDMILRTGEAVSSLNKKTVQPVLRQLRDDNEKYDSTEFCDYTKRLDKVRNNKLRDSIPNLWEVMKDEFDD